MGLDMLLPEPASGAFVGRALWRALQSPGKAWLSSGGTHLQCLTHVCFVWLSSHDEAGNACALVYILIVGVTSGT